MVPTKYKGDHNSQDVLKVFIPDDWDYRIDKHFEETNTFIFERLKARKKVLVHCRMGISRSVTILCAYLMRANLWDAHEALAYVQVRRPDAEPNAGFVKRLYRYNNYIASLRLV